jgi:hypothetical protein
MSDKALAALLFRQRRRSADCATPDFKYKRRAAGNAAQSKAAMRILRKPG